MSAELKFIGSIKTPYTSSGQCPNNIQPDGPLCEIAVVDRFKDGLIGLKVGHHILILYWFENVDRDVALQKPARGGNKIGTFALRSPHRPNPIAAAVLPIEAIENGSVFVKGLDCVNGTRLLDIKPAIMNELSSSQ